jgi:hypothetical protein
VNKILRLILPLRAFVIVTICLLGLIGIECAIGALYRACSTGSTETALMTGMHIGNNGSERTVFVDLVSETGKKFSSDNPELILAYFSDPTTPILLNLDWNGELNSAQLPISDGE